MLSYFVWFTYCVISNSANEMWQIDVPYSEVVPDIIKVLENSSVTIYCGSTSPVHWMYAGKNLDLISRYEPLLPKHLQSPKQLTLHNLSRSDIGFYSCLGTNGDTIFSTLFYVIVFNSSIPKTIMVPSWVEISAGGSVTLLCGSDGPVEWFSVHISHQDKLIQNNTLTLFNLQRKHSGQYFCRGTQYERYQQWSVDDDYDDHREFRSLVFHAYSNVIVDGVVNRVQ